MIWRKARIAKPVEWDGENVWNGEWFAAALYPGPRRLFVLRASDTPFPVMLTPKREPLSPTGQLREAIAEWQLEQRRRGKAKDVVIDGRLGILGPSGMIDFPRAPLAGSHLPPGASLYADDIITLPVFKERAGTMPYGERRRRLVKLVARIGSPRVVATSYERIEKRKQFDKLREAVAGYRNFGLVLRRDAPYRAGRTGDVLTVRPDDDD